MKDFKNGIGWRGVQGGALVLAAVFAACRSENDVEPDGGACSTPAFEDLQPHFDFSAVDEGSSTNDDGGVLSVRGDGGVVVGDAGVVVGDGGPAVDDGGVRNGDPPSSGGGSGNGPTIPQFAIGNLPNEFGRGANMLMPNVLLRTFDDASLGTNGRHCSTCHADDSQWTIHPANLQERFNDGLPFLSRTPERFPTNDTARTNDELEPIFRLVDGANSPLAAVETPEARRRAYSMLLGRAVIRLGLSVPSDAQFDVIAVDDPYGFASAERLSLFRRPPMMANLRFHTVLMWDGRETVSCETLRSGLRTQANHAVADHAQGPRPSDSAIDQIVDTELGIYFAQRDHLSAGTLNADGAHGGPTFLAQVPFYVGINAFDTIDPRGRSYAREVFSLFTAWRDRPGPSPQDRARATIAEGERVFDTREFTVRGVSGFNDTLRRSEIVATCGACHNTPNVGTSSEGRLMDIGISDESRRGTELPLYTLRKKNDGAIVKTTDPGQALITGQWSHVNRLKVPSLRALAGRAPYFHDGSAASLEAVVDHHDRRFAIGLTAEEKAALVAFLSAL